MNAAAVAAHAGYNPLYVQLLYRGHYVQQLSCKHCHVSISPQQ
jgi:hypothetical protein